MNDAIIDGFDNRFALQPVPGTNRSEEAGGQFQGNGHFPCGMPDSIGKRAIRERTHHSTMHEAHAVAVSLKNPDAASQITFCRRATNRAVTGREWTARF